MVIEKVHGLQATNISLNERFTMWATAVPERAPMMRPRRRPSTGFYNQNFNMKNRNLIEQIARRLEMQAKRQAVKQRLGMLRRFGSESSLPGLRRSNSFSNLSQFGDKNRIPWRQSNGNLSRSASFSNLSWGLRRGYRRRGGQRVLRGHFRGGFQGNVRVLRVRRLPQGTRGRGQGRGRGRGQGQGRGRGRGRGQGRGVLPRNQNQKPVMSKEELDRQLDQYMASTKSTLDKELDNYMKNAMEME